MSDDDADQAPSAERPSWRLVDSLPICSAAFLLRTSWICRVDGGRSLQYNAVFCGGACRLPMQPMAIIVLLSSGSTTMMCVGTVLVFFSVGVMPVCIEVFFFSSCDERQMF